MAKTFHAVFSAAVAHAMRQRNRDEWYSETRGTDKPRTDVLVCVPHESIVHARWDPSSDLCFHFSAAQLWYRIHCVT
jgi:hypothetical protein